MSGNFRSDGAITAAGRGQACIPSASKVAQFRKLKNIPANGICFDCPNTRPTWASTTYGVLLCLDCSATHRSMGVHITFVRSLDLDEWTQRQIDAMKIGGNDNARKFFRKHGCTDFHTTKKYTSRAATAYRAELAKLVDKEGAKRGEALSAPSAAATGGGSLLDNLDAAMQQQTEEEARKKLEEARSNGSEGGSASAGVLHPSAKLAASMAGAKGKLNVTPPVSGGLTSGGNGSLLKPPSSAGGPKLVLRKPSSSSASSKLYKKTSSLSTSRIRVNRLSAVTSPSGGNEGMDSFEDVEAAQKAMEEQKQKEEEQKKRQMEEDAMLAKKLGAELNGLGNGASGNGAAAPVNVAPAVKDKPTPKVSAMQESMAKLSAMNSDFFSGM